MFLSYRRGLVKNGQNVFDDFIAAREYLIRELNITLPATFGRH